MDFRTWVREQRQSKRMTQASCAALAGMTIQQWNQIEKQVRQPEIVTIRRIAQALDVAPEDALVAAGYPVAEAISPCSSRLAYDLDRILGKLPDEHKRKTAEQILKRQAEDLVRAMTPV